MTIELDVKKQNLIISALKKSRNIRSCHTISGQFDILVMVRADNSTQMDELLDWVNGLDGGPKDDLLVAAGEKIRTLRVCRDGGHICIIYHRNTKSFAAFCASLYLRITIRHRSDSPPPSRRSRIMTTANALVKMLSDYGVEVIFGVPGDTNVALYQALKSVEGAPRHILCRDERSAVFMADCYARLSGKPGVAECPSGAGAMYALPGIAEANQSSVPVILLVNDIPQPAVGRGTLTDLAVVDLFKPITKHAESLASAQKMPEVVRRAFRNATGGRPGAVVLNLPEDLLFMALPAGQVSLACRGAVQDGPGVPRPAREGRDSPGARSAHGREASFAGSRRRREPLPCGRGDRAVSRAVAGSGGDHDHRPGDDPGRPSPCDRHHRRQRLSPTCALGDQPGPTPSSTSGAAWDRWPPCTGSSQRRTRR